MRSSSFESHHSHVNPKLMPITSTEYRAPSVQVGVFHLSDGLIEKISTFHVINNLKVVPGANVKVSNGYFFHGEKPLNPEIGDVRVQFLYAGW